jgi:hypothetical protein
LFCPFGLPWLLQLGREWSLEADHPSSSVTRFREISEIDDDILSYGGSVRQIEIIIIGHCLIKPSVCIDLGLSWIGGYNNTNTQGLCCRRVSHIWRILYCLHSSSCSQGSPRCSYRALRVDPLTSGHFFTRQTVVVPLQRYLKTLAESRPETLQRHPMEGNYSYRDSYAVQAHSQSSLDRESLAGEAYTH